MSVERQLIAVGLDHTTARIELRERVAFTDGELPAVLAQLTDPADPLLEQAAIVSTCNRVEVYGVGRAQPHELASFLARYHGLDPRELGGALYARRGDEVPHHLAATAAGMHSLVLGEVQIQGQVRTALDHALAAGTAGPELRRLFESAIATGRRVRSRTGLSRGVASVAQASVELVLRRLGSLSDSTVLVIGAGSVGVLVAKHVARHDPHELLVIGRDVTRDRLGEALAQADVVISATGAPHPVVRREHLEQRDAPVLLVDLAVPRDVEPAVAGLPGVELYTIDDLREHVERTLAQRRSHLPAASAIVRAEVARFTRWLSRRRLAPA